MYYDKSCLLSNGHWLVCPMVPQISTSSFSNEDNRYLNSESTWTIPTETRVETKTPLTTTTTTSIFSFFALLTQSTPLRNNVFSFHLLPLSAMSFKQTPSTHASCVVCTYFYGLWQTDNGQRILLTSRCNSLIDFLLKSRFFWETEVSFALQATTSALKVNQCCREDSVMCHFIFFPRMADVVSDLLMISMSSAAPVLEGCPMKLRTSMYGTESRRKRVGVGVGVGDGIWMIETELQRRSSLRVATAMTAKAWRMLTWRTMVWRTVVSMAMAWIQLTSVAMRGWWWCKGKWRIWQWAKG